MDTFSGTASASLSMGKLGAQIAEQTDKTEKYVSVLDKTINSEKNLKKEAEDAGKAVENQSKAISEAFEKTKKWNTALYNLGEYMARWGKSGSAYFTGLAGGYAASATTIVAYNNLAGDSAAALMSGIRTASNGTISSVEMMTAANNALALGLKAETIPELARVATALGTVTGTDAGAMFTTLSSGVSASTAQLLAQQGIILDTTAAYAQYAAGIGSTASALTEQQQQTALLYALMEQGQTLTDAAGNSQYALGTSMEQAEASVASMNFAMAEATAGPMRSWYSLVAGTAGVISGLPQPLLAVVGGIGMVGTAVAGTIGPLMMQVGSLLLAINNWRLIKAEMVAMPLLSKLTSFSLGGVAASLYTVAGAAWAVLVPFLPLIGAIAAVVGIAAGLDYLINGSENSFVGKMLNPQPSDFSDTTSGTTQYINVTNSPVYNAEIQAPEMTRDQFDQLIAEHRQRFLQESDAELKRTLMTYA